MKTNHASDDTKDPNLKVIRFGKLHNDTAEWRERDGCYDYFTVQAKKRFGVVLSEKTIVYKIKEKNCPGVNLSKTIIYFQVFCLGSDGDKKYNIGRIIGLNEPGLEKDSYLRSGSWEIIWVPDNLVATGWLSNPPRLNRDQSRMVLDVWRALDGYGPR